MSRVTFLTCASKFTEREQFSTSREIFLSGRRQIVVTSVRLVSLSGGMVKGGTVEYRSGRRHRHTTRRRSDAGVTFVEILVSIVLLGTAVVGTLTAVRTTIISADIERDHSKAQQWLQSAVGVIESVDFSDCSDPGLDETAILNDYQNAINLSASAPFGFQGLIQVVAPLEVWDGTEFVPFATQTLCYDDVLLRQQLVTVEVQSTDGDISERLQIVKRDRQ